MKGRKILIINGPNLNLLGKREPEIYGVESLDEIIEYTQNKLNHLELTWFQSNIEGEIVDKIQECFEADYAGLIINPGGYTHTSVAIHDALKLIKIPVTEVHLTNTAAREDFRANKITTRVATRVMEGFGRDSYYLAAYYINEEVQ